MKISKLTTALGALALIATPIVAQAAEAPVRASADVTDAENMAGGGGIIVALLALAAVIGGVVIALEDDEEPTSP